MAGLSESVRKMMQAKAEEAKKRMSSGNFTKTWNLTGKNAIVQPGEEVVVRFGPRWDIAIVTTKTVGGKAIVTATPNPGYVSGEQPIFVSAWEHWWDADGGKTQHEWCPKTLNPEAECPVCIAASISLKSGDEDDRKYGKRIQAKEVYIFNAVVGQAGVRKLADGKADFRTISVPGTIYTAVTDIMTGGSDESFARGNVGDHAEGYDLKLKRPAKDGNDRWAVVCAPNPSPLYDAKQAAAFKDWTTMLVNLDGMLSRETKTPLDLFKAFYGRDPEADEMTPALAEGVQVAEKEAAPEPEPEPEAQNTEPILDEFMPKPAAGGVKAAPTPPKAAPKAAAPRTGGRR